MKPIFEVKNLTAGYNTPIISDISFAVNSGEIVGIIGKNGQGKTTLLRGITGTAKRFSGEIFINGQNCVKLSPKKQATLLSLLSQKTLIPEGVTVRDILEMGCYPHHSIFEGITAEEKNNIRHTAEKLGVFNFYENDCSKLSIGQQQMVFLCRMLVQNTPVMLFDEPNSALDYSNTRMLFKILNNVIKEDNRAGILVIHDPEIVLQWCDRMLVIDNGKLVENINIKLSNELEIQKALNHLYPEIKVKINPFNGQYFCYFEEK